MRFMVKKQYKIDKYVSHLMKIVLNGPQKIYLFPLYTKEDKKTLIINLTIIIEKICGNIIEIVLVTTDCHSIINST